MEIRKEDTSVNHQHGSHEEGQQNNIRPHDQQLNDTNAQPMSNMMQEDVERKKQGHDPEAEERVRDEQRLP